MLLMTIKGKEAVTVTVEKEGHRRLLGQPLPHSRKQQSRQKAIFKRALKNCDENAEVWLSLLN